MMIVTLVRRDGESMVMERIDAQPVFVGGAAQEGVLITFELNGQEVTGRIVRISDPAPDQGDESAIEVELIDEAEQEIESEVTLANLPPGGDTDTEI